MLSVCVCVCALPFFSWKEHAMTKVIKASYGERKIRGPKKNWQKTAKKKVVPNCLKWRENWSDIVLNFWVPHPKQIKGNFSQKKKSKLFQIV